MNRSTQTLQLSDVEFLLRQQFPPNELSHAAPTAEQPKKMTRLAALLFVATLLSTFWSGVSAWLPYAPLLQAWSLGSALPVRQAILANWLGGVQFSLALMAILLAHELGHYLMTLYYRVPSTPPLFIPFPFISPIGTMGAVIMMRSGTANRKQIFDIGIAGPLAGLIVACPIIAWGILDGQHLDHIANSPSETLVFGQPLLIQWLASWLAPEHADRYVQIANSDLNPLLMAGWVGLLVTGLNMMPLGQLDGGHVTFGLLGHRSFFVALLAVTAAVIYMVVTQVAAFALMLLLVFLMGLRHPPSSDDNVKLGPIRQVIGWASLLLPILCIPGNPLTTP